MNHRGRQPRWGLGGERRGDQRCHQWRHRLARVPRERVDWQPGQGGATPILLTNGNVTGGAYLVTAEGGASALVDGVTARVPSLATCLGL